MGNTVTRAQLTEAIYQEVGLSRNESSDLVESILGEVSNALARGEMVKISSFGSFAVRQKGRRIGACWGFASAHDSCPKLRKCKRYTVARPTCSCSCSFKKEGS